jgi:thiamine-monophosphate kinase
MKTGEFDRIKRFFAPLASGFPGALGLSDDAAILAPASGYEFVVTTDTLVEGVHFIGDEPPARIAAKMLRVNLSDLAAMGARPVSYTLNIALPNDVNDEWLSEFCDGLAADQREFGIRLMGGDSVATPGPKVFTVTAFGETPMGCALRRNGARPGDLVFVSGTIGDAALGLRLVRGELSTSDTKANEELTGRYQSPSPRLALGTGLVGLASAAADVSDGLLADLGHITQASGVGATLEWSAIPLSDAARSIGPQVADMKAVVLSGGDDYELVFTAPPGAVSALIALSARLSMPISRIGVVNATSGVRVTDEDGRDVRIEKTGYSHG